jgi:anti-sigma factor RsiW
MSSGCAEVEPLHSAWVDGSLDADARVRVSGHLQDCDACRADVEGLERTRALLRNLPVRRLPAGVDTVPPPPPRRAPRHRARASGRPARPARPVRQRLTTGLALLMAMIGGAAFALGGQPSADDRLVTVPVDLFVADHLVHTVGGPMFTPVVVDSRR